jgi:D-glycerate 3-kinase
VSGKVDPGLLERVRGVVRALEASVAGRAWVLGVSGPQGSGKSTLARALVDEGRARGQSLVALSVDDIYLPRAELVRLARAHPGVVAFEQRGYPGTHDVALGTRILDALRGLGPGERVRVVRYDKSAHGGLGDRAPEEGWSEVVGPLDGVVLEGWMLGMRPLGAGRIEPSLRAPDDALDAYAAWHARLDGLVVLTTRDPESIVRWRVEAERERREAGQGALSDEEAEAYVRRFLPAYRAWVPGLIADPPCAGPTLFVELGPDRAPLASRARG